MSVTPLRDAPLDQSAAIMHVRYLQGDRLAFIQRIHLTTGAPTGVASAFDAYADVVKEYYDSAWTIQLSALDLVEGGNPSRVPCPVAADRTGTGVIATTGIAGLTQTIFVFALDELDVSNAGHKGRLRFLGIGGSVPDKQYKVSATAGGTIVDQALVALVTNPAHVYCAHDGLKFLAPATRSTPLDRPERRRSMRAA